MIEPAIFQSRLLTWFKTHGRHHLPWQNPRTPYRVWISEIMLQQTQVTTVIPYFKRFIEAFPTLSDLAMAHQDQVLHLWAGLGYYARARYLHKTAQIIHTTFKGEFPKDLVLLQTLPGIGRSTAGAILSLGFNEPFPILDGNVKRIFSRLHAIAGPLNNGKVIKSLWVLAETYHANQYSREYTQAIMDFGSLICIRKNPHCHTCPMQTDCIAARNDQVNQYPTLNRKPPKPVRTLYFLLLVNAQQEILLEKRPPVGIWGGLWSVPECSLETDIKSFCLHHYRCHITSMKPLDTIQHTFTHFHLSIQPLVCDIQFLPAHFSENINQIWISKNKWQTKGVAAPVKQLLQQIFK